MVLGLLAAFLVQEIPADNHWTRYGHSVYAPAGAPPAECFLNVLPPTDFKGGGAEWQDAVWKDVCRGAPTPPERTTGTAGAFAWFSTVGDAGGTRRWFTFYTAAADGRADLVVFVAASEALHKAHSAAAQ